MKVNRVADVFRAYVDSADIRAIISVGKFARLADSPTLPAEEWLGLHKETRDAIMDYARDYVRMDDFRGGEIGVHGENRNGRGTKRAARKSTLNRFIRHFT